MAVHQSHAPLTILVDLGLRPHFVLSLQNQNIFALAT